MPDPASMAGPHEAEPMPSLTDLEALRAEQAALRAEVDQLRGTVERLCTELGLRPL